MTASKTRDQFPLSPKKIIKKTLASVIAWIIVFLILYGFLIFILIASSKTIGIIPSLIGIGLLGVLCVLTLLTYLYQRWYYNVYFYDLTPDYIVIRKGPITPREITIPYERIQDVYVDQDIFDRIFGLYDVHLSSATVSSGMEAHIDGVEKPAADGLRTLLLKTVSQRISKSKGQSVLPPTAEQTS
jgi:membrane protein YdbS with pleckstrin-like domain